MILVTGGAGYIGSHVVKSLLAEKYEVLVLDNLSTGHRDAVDNRARFVETDLMYAGSVNKVFQDYQVDAVLHFAAKSIVADSVVNPLRTFSCNLTGTLNLLNAMVSNKVSELVFSSTAAVYGEPDKVPIDEEHKLEPTNPYGESKLFMEKIFSRLNNTGNLNYVALRYFNASGADYKAGIGEDHNPETHLIPIVLAVAAGQKEELSVYGDDYPTEDGTAVRDYIHVKDLVSAHILALESLLAKINQKAVYNLGNEVGHSVLDVIESAEKVTGKKIKRYFGPRREGDPSVLVASSEKIKKELGWDPVHSNIDNIVDSAWRWHSQNPHGYKKIVL